MSVVDLLVGSVAAFAVLSWFLIPLVRRRLLHDRTASSVSRAAVLALLGFLRTTALVVTVTTAATAAAIWLLGQSGVLSLGLLASAVDMAQAVRAQLSSLNVVWSGIVLSVLVVGLALHSWRRGKLRFTKAFDRKREEELERLKQEYEQGRWEELPPTPVMLAIDKELAEVVPNFRARQSLSFGRSGGLRIERASGSRGWSACDRDCSRRSTR